MTKNNIPALVLFATCATIASGQIGNISIYAGNANGVFPGNGGPATSALITNPFGVATDASGNLYIAASGNSLIRQVNAATGIITTVAGGGTGGDGGLAIAAQLSGPCDVKVDPAGNLFLSETCVEAQGGSGSGGGGTGLASISRIRRVDATTGIITTIAGTTSSGFAGDGGPATAALLNLPVGLGIDSNGNIFVADSGNNRIRRIDGVSGIITTVAGNGAAAFTGDSGPATSASLNGPAGVAIDASGNLYIADTGNNCIRRVDAITGVITTVAGTGSTAFNGDGIAATTANLNTPASVAINSGTLFISDLGNGRVRMIDNAGIIWTIAGNGFAAPTIGGNLPSSAVILNGPVGLAFQPSGPLFIAELETGRVDQVVLPSSVAATASFASTTAATFAPNSPVTLTATLTATNGLAQNATGFVEFMDPVALTFIGNGVIANGSMQFTTSTLGLGVHNIVAIYLGDANFGRSASPPITVTIANPPPTVALSASPSPGVANQPVTLTAIVSPSSLTGSVIFYQGAIGGQNFLGSVNVNNGVATLTTVFLAGSYSMIAQLSTINGTVTSPTVVLNVKTSSSVAVTSSVNPSNPGQPVTFTASVPRATATGTVQFSDGSTVIGTANLVTGEATFSTSTLTVGQHSITAVYSGDANNTSSGSSPITQTVLASSSLTMSSSVNPSNANQSVTFTASVTPTPATGSIQFSDGSTVIGTANLVGGVATFSTSTLTSGQHSITASYSGDANHATATSSPVVQTVLIVTSVVLSSAQNPSAVGASVTFAATVVPSAATGTVQFLDGSTTIGTAPVTGGAASFTTSSLTQGTHLITAVYSGDTSNATSTSAALSQAVKLTTGLALTSSLNPAVVGQTVAFTATANTAATGTVQFLDGTTVLGAVPVSSGVAVFSTTSLTQGTHTITATYSGDTNYLTASSTALAETVNAKTATVTTAASTPNPSTGGGIVTVTASVSPATATGTVQFLDGAAVLGTATVANGTASFATSTLTPGSHSITAAYSGDATNLASASAAISQTVLTPTTVTLTSNLNPSTFGQAVTFTAQVSPSTATGTVRFVDGSVVFATGTLSNGTASVTTSTLGVFSHLIFVVYSGDSNDATSTSVQLSQTVNKTPTSVALTSSPNPATVGQTVTLTAVVSPRTATGLVQFFDGGSALLGTVSLTNGMATLVLTPQTFAFSVGTHSLTANYNSDANDALSTSPVVNQVITKALTSVTLSSSLNPAISGQSVTFTAIVSPSSATGSVQFLDGSSIVGTASVSGGSVALTLSTLVTGSHSITAVYGGDSSDLASTSAVLTETVNAAAPSPSNLTATAAGSSQINLVWMGSPTSGVTYDVYESTTSGFVPSASNRIATGVAATAYSITGLSGATTYYYRVSAVKAGVESTDTNQASATTAVGISCQVKYKVDTQWNVGFGAEFSIKNTGSTPINSWTLTFAWPGNQVVTESWNSNFAQSGANVTFTHASWNANIAAGATLSGMGFNASYQGSNPTPTAFYVNGTLCH